MTATHGQHLELIVSYSELTVLNLSDCGAESGLDGEQRDTGNSRVEFHFLLRTAWVSFFCFSTVSISKILLKVNTTPTIEAALFDSRFPYHDTHSGLWHLCLYSFAVFQSPFNNNNNKKTTWSALPSS